jgi:transposase
MVAIVRPVFHNVGLIFNLSNIMGKQQIHKKFSEEQAIVILENYLAGEISAGDAMEKLELKKSQFYNLAAQYKNNSQDFSIKHKGNSGNRGISKEAEKAILKELESEKKLIDNKDISIRNYNYSAVRDELKTNCNITVSLSTIINKAKKNGYHLGKPAAKIHDREVLTNLAGELLQHDSSHHLWSPYMEEKLYLITTIDDYSRLILYAELVEQENVWAHIMGLKSVFLQYGCPFKYYPDQHAIFRYVKDRDKNRPHNDFQIFTDDTDPQWKQVLKECGVGITYALSPQAKGKIERPYRWLQDRIYRTAAKQKLKTAGELRVILKELKNTYNTKWVHSTTKEIPILRFEDAVRNKKSLFKPLRINDGRTIDDIFCLRAQRVVDSYRKISLNNLEIKVPGGTPRQIVDMKISLDENTGLIRIRFWQGSRFLGEILEQPEKLPIFRF